MDDWVLLATYANRLVLKTLLRQPAARERRQLAALLAARRDG